MEDLPRQFTIRESGVHQIRRIHLRPGSWRRSGRLSGCRRGRGCLTSPAGPGKCCAPGRETTGSSAPGWTSAASSSARRGSAPGGLGVEDRVSFVHGDASGYAAREPVGVAACVGATWIGGGVAGTVELLRRSLVPGGIMLIGEPYWRKEPPDRETVEGAAGTAQDEWVGLGNLLGSFGDMGLDVVEMVLADGDSWDLVRGGEVAEHPAMAGREPRGRALRRDAGRAGGGTGAARPVPARVPRVGRIRADGPVAPAGSRVIPVRRPWGEQVPGGEPRRPLPQRTANGRPSRRRPTSCRPAGRPSAVKPAGPRRRGGRSW